MHAAAKGALATARHERQRAAAAWRRLMSSSGPTCRTRPCWRDRQPYTLLQNAGYSDSAAGKHCWMGAVGHASRPVQAGSSSRFVCSRSAKQHCNSQSRKSGASTRDIVDTWTGFEGSIRGVCYVAVQCEAGRTGRMQHGTVFRRRALPNTGGMRRPSAQRPTPQQTADQAHCRRVNTELTRLAGQTLTIFMSTCSEGPLQSFAGSPTAQQAHRSMIATRDNGKTRPERDAAGARFLEIAVAGKGG